MAIVITIVVAIFGLILCIGVGAYATYSDTKKEDEGFYVDEDGKIYDFIPAKNFFVRRYEEDVCMGLRESLIELEKARFGDSIYSENLRLVTMEYLKEKNWTISFVSKNVPERYDYYLVPILKDFGKRWMEIAYNFPNRAIYDTYNYGPYIGRCPQGDSLEEHGWRKILIKEKSSSVYYLAYLHDESGAVFYRANFIGQIGKK